MLIPAFWESLAGISFWRSIEQTSGAEPGGLAVALLLDERPIFCRTVERVECRLEGDLVLPGEWFRREWIRTMDGVVDHRSDPSTLEE